MRKFNVIIDGVSYGVEVEESLEDIGKEISMDAIEAAQIKTEEPKPAPKVEPKAMPKTSAAPAGGFALKSPMPGMIMGFKVQTGAAVKKGQVVMSLEAMKMENDISSPADGVITFVAVKGANVNAGDILAYIK